MMNINNDELKKLYETSPAAKMIFDHYVVSKKQMSKTSVNTLCVALKKKGHSVTRSQLIWVLKKLDAMGCGLYISGRRGGQTRIVWNGSVVNLSKIACNHVATVKGIYKEIVKDKVSNVVENKLTDYEQTSIKCVLRLELVAGLSLPINLTHEEASRLANFIKTLTFEDENLEAA